jgi:hypothetical protein
MPLSRAIGGAIVQGPRRRHPADLGFGFIHVKVPRRPRQVRRVRCGFSGEVELGPASARGVVGKGPRLEGALV